MKRLYLILICIFIGAGAFGQTIANVAVSDPTCGNSNGVITITATGGTGALTYSIDNGVTFQAGNSFTGLAAFTYNIVVEDVNSSQATTQVTLTDPGAPSINNVAFTNPSCGNNDGSINITITGGSPPYNVTYIDTATGISNTIPAISLPISGLHSTTYNLSVSDQNGCAAHPIVVDSSFNTVQAFIPDGTGVSYTSDIVISSFNTGQSLSSINQINSICATMEHSYASDLTIELIAPGGQTIQLKNFGTTGAGVNTCDMGEPIASGPVDNWSTSNTNPGVGYQYCWTNTPTYPTMNNLISPIAPGPPPSHTYTTLAGNSCTDYFLPAGSYTPHQSIVGLLGTSLNGTWTLKVTDNSSQDNGYIFDWAISLQADLPDSIVTLTLTAPGATITGVAEDLSLLCNGDCNGQITAAVVGGTLPYAYSWVDGLNNPIGGSSSTLSSLCANTYTLTVTDNGGAGCPVVMTYVLNEPATVTVTVTAASNLLTVNNVNSGVTYQWLDCNNNYAILSGETGQSYTVTVSGNYAVEVTENSCVDTSACYNILFVGIEESSFRNDLVVYPNPTKDNFSIDLRESYQAVTITITNLDGKLIQSKTYHDSQLLNLNIENPAGIYLILVESGNKKAVIRLVKE